MGKTPQQWGWESEDDNTALTGISGLRSGGTGTGPVILAWFSTASLL